LAYAPSDVLLTGIEGISRKDQVLDIGRYTFIARSFVWEGMYFGK
jgi:hypothetical protein